MNKQKAQTSTPRCVLNRLKLSSLLIFISTLGSLVVSSCLISLKDEMQPNYHTVHPRIRLVCPISQCIKNIVLRWSTSSGGVFIYACTLQITA